MNKNEPCYGLTRGSNAKWLASVIHDQFPLLGMLCLLMFQIGGARNDTVQRISRSDLKPLKDGMPGEQAVQREVILSTGVKMSAAIEVTTKGNGNLRIGNLNLK